MGTHTFRGYATALVAMVLVISALLTAIFILDVRYRAEHYVDASLVKVPVTLPDNPYLLPARIMTAVSLCLPMIATLGMSFRYFRNAEASLGKRYWKAVGLSCLIFPLICLQYLPWTVYQALQTPGYLQFDEFLSVLVWLPIYSAFVVLLSLGLNGFGWFREYRRQRIADS